MTTSTFNTVITGRTRLLLRHPFFGTILCHQKLVYDAPGIDTMAVDGTHLYVCMAFAEKLTKSELEFVLAHEAMHLALAHHARMGSRDPRTWNIACDYVINLVLKNSNLVPPKDALLDAKYTGMTAEQVYDLLGSQGSSPSQGSSDPGGCGGVIAPRGTPAEVAAAIANNKIQVRQAAAIAAAHPGNQPAYLSTVLAAIEPVPMDWTTVLSTLIDDACQRDYSWSRRSRSSGTMPYYLPGLVPDGISHITCVVDTSGSIDMPMLKTFLGVIDGIRSAVGIATTTVIYADTMVHTSTDYVLGETITPKPVGGGGTDFSQPMSYIQTAYPHTRAVVYLTDMETNSFGLPVDGATHVWVAPAKCTITPPFGSVVNMPK